MATAYNLLQGIWQLNIQVRTQAFDDKEFVAKMDAMASQLAKYKPELKGAALSAMHRCNVLNPQLSEQIGKALTDTK